MTAAVRRPVPLWLKGTAAAALVVLADLLFFDRPLGATLGVFCLALAVAVAVLRPEVRRSRKALAALGIAVVLGVLQIENPTFLGWVLFWVELATAVLWSRAGRADDAWRWLQRLVVFGAVGLVGPLLDLMRMHRLKRRRRSWPLLRLVSLLALPALGGAVFVALFAAANPLISEVLSGWELPELNAVRLVFWGLVALLAWSFLRPRFLKRPLATPSAEGDVGPPGVSVASVTLSLVVFNALFAIQNGLDLAFLWSGAPLPEGVTLAAYAHRGAYPLIATALLAGLFVLVALAPGSRTAASPMVRWLVVLWVAQNLFLVGSSVLRTLDYIEVYSLTRLRIAALLWMGLVGLGLILICWRMLRGLSSSWLINANVLAASLVLAACAVVDLGAVAAGWNGRHAREVGGRGAALDVCYLRRLGPSALVALAGLERQKLPPDLEARVASARAAALDDLAQRQADWRGWTWRGERRLARAAALGATGPAPERSCEPAAPTPALLPAPRAVEPALTSAAESR